MKELKLSMYLSLFSYLILSAMRDMDKKQKDEEKPLRGMERGKRMRALRDNIMYVYILEDSKFLFSTII